MARLAEVRGLEDAATDHSGTLLRLRAPDTAAVDAARLALTGLGYDSEELPADDERTLLSSRAAWYGRERIDELSREEAASLAEEATSAFARDTPLTPSERARLRSDVEEALFTSFTAGEHVPGGLVERALPRIVERASTHLGEERAARLAEVLRSWSAARRRS